MENAFIKPERMVINAIPYLTEILGNGLIKDLQEGEEICPVCHGTGLAIDQSSYGLSDDPDKKTGIFPYRKQTIVSCRNCFNGVVKRCPYCGELISSLKSRCECEGTKRSEEEASQKKRKERFEKAKKLEPGDVQALAMQMLQSDEYPYHDGYFDSWDEFFNAWFDQYEGIEERPKYVWGTYTTNISFNVDDLLERACEELHEDARNQICQADVDELHGFLDTWAKKQSGTETYTCDTRYAIRIPWKPEK